MNQSVTYRQNAAECYEAARILSDSRQKAKLLAMAQSWISLADLADLNSHLDDPRRSAPWAAKLAAVSCHLTGRGRPINTPSPAPPCHALRRIFGLVLHRLGQDERLKRD